MIHEKHTRDYQNKYTQRTVTNKVDILGIANPTASVTLNGNTAARKGEYFHYPLTVANSTAQYPTITALSSYGATQSEAGEVFVPSSTESFGYDADGNLTSDGRWTYIWDGENRLVELYRNTSTPTLSSRLRLVFEYDYLGRRIGKSFYTNNATAWVFQTQTKFVYDRWNVVGELDASNVKQRTYIWGLGLSGSRHGTGGVGGLLKVTDHVGSTTHHFVAYDGNGNVLSLNSAANAAITAIYAYGPFGEPIQTSGAMARRHPFRFSTKFTDNESGLLYYGYRYYAPSTGRWKNRDPIRERGGRNIFAAFGNRPTITIDSYGLVFIDKGSIFDFQVGFGASGNTDSVFTISAVCETTADCKCTLKLTSFVVEAESQIALYDGKPDQMTDDGRVPRFARQCRGISGPGKKLNGDEGVAWVISAGFRPLPRFVAGHSLREKAHLSIMRVGQFGMTRRHF